MKRAAGESARGYRPGGARLLVLLPINLVHFVFCFSGYLPSPPDVMLRTSPSRLLVSTSTANIPVVVPVHVGLSCLCCG